MAYKKIQKKGGPRKWARKAGGTSWFKNYRNAGAQLWRDVKYLKSLVNTEFKLKEGTYGGNPGTGTTGNITLINGLVRGTDYTNLTGRSCRWKSVQVSMRFVNSLNALNTVAARVNYALVIDKTPQESTFTLPALFSNIEGQFRNLDNRKRFVILKQGSKVVDPDDNTQLVKFYHKLDMHTIYDDTNDGSIVDIRANALFLVTWTTDTTYPPDQAINYRLRFIDN